MIPHTGTIIANDPKMAQLIYNRLDILQDDGLVFFGFLENDPKEGQTTFTVTLNPNQTWNEFSS